MAPSLGVEPRPSALQADALPLRQDGVIDGVLAKHPSSSTIQLSETTKLKHLVPDPGVEPGLRGSRPRVVPLDQSGSRAHLSREAAAGRSAELDAVEPRGSTGRRASRRVWYRSCARKAKEPPRCLLVAPCVRAVRSAFQTNGALPPGLPSRPVAGPCPMAKIATAPQSSGSRMRDQRLAG